MSKLNNKNDKDNPNANYHKLNKIDHIVREKIKHDHLIKKHIKELKDIVSCISDGLVLIDRFNRYHFLNDAGMNYFYQPETLKFSGDSFNFTQYYDFNGKRLSVDDMVGPRSLRGETIINEKVKAVRPDGTIYVSINANPVYDDHHQIIYAILSIRDITKEIEQINLIAKQQEDFLYLITHEFRTPIAVVNSALQAINLICINDIPPKILKYLNTIKQNTNRQLRLVNNLLENTRISAGNIKLNYSKFDIVFVTGEIVKSVDLYSKQKKLILEFNSSIRRKRVILDEEKYERILLNLLSNAFKFTPKGKRIRVFLSVKSRNHRSMICLSIEDEGIGIPKEMQQMIFERFGQADTVLSRQAEGTGLGLHLVKLIVESLDGEVLLESEEGKGSKFTVYLPLKNKLDEAVILENTRSINEDDTRIDQAVSIEFSDVYYNR